MSSPSMGSRTVRRSPARSPLRWNIMATAARSARMPPLRLRRAVDLFIDNKLLYRVLAIAAELDYQKIRVWHRRSPLSPGLRHPIGARPAGAERLGGLRSAEAPSRPVTKSNKSN